MSVNERIYYDSKELTQRIEANLDHLKTFQYDSRYRTLLGDDFVDTLSKWDRNIRSRKDDPFTLVVCGDFKRGKSSLINALLGEDVVTTNVTTETVTLNYISYGEHRNEAVLTGGKRMILSDSELARDALEDIMDKTGERIYRLNITRPVEVLRDITIIDTPGLGDSACNFQDEVDQALGQADAVVYVFSVSFPLSRMEQLYLKSSILPQKYTSLFLVANFCDTMPDKDALQRMTELLNERVAGILPGQPIYMLSALDERCTQMGENVPNADLHDFLGNSFGQFRRDMNSILEDRRALVLPDRMERMTRLMLKETESQLKAIEHGLNADSDELNRTISGIAQERQKGLDDLKSKCGQVREIVNGYETDTHEWMEGVLSRLKEDSKKLSSISTDDIVKYYAIFCVDALQNAMQNCVDRHMESLMDTLETLSDDLTQEFSKHMIPVNCDFRMTIQNRTWTKGDNVSFVASKLSSGFLGIAANGIGGLLRKKELQDKNPQIIQSIAAQYNQLGSAVRKEIEKVYQGIADYAEQILRVYYEEQFRSLEIRTEQLNMAARKSDDEKKQVREVIEQIRKELNGVRLLF